MSKNNRSVRPRLISSPTSPLELARQTGLNRRQVRRLGQALASCSDLEGLLYQLPLRAVEPFLIAAFLDGRPVTLEKVVSVLPRLSAPLSMIRVVSVTCGDRIGALLDLMESESLEPFIRASLLYLCVDLLESGRASSRLVENLRQACQARNTWMSSVLLRDIAVRLEITELLRLTRPAAPLLHTPAGRMMACHLRHQVFQPPLVNLPETELSAHADDPLAQVSSQPDDSQRPKVLQSIAVPVHHLAEANFETVESGPLLLTYQLLAGAGMWEPAERALDELMHRGLDSSYRENFKQLLVTNGQLALAERQAAKHDEQRPDEPSWMRPAA